MVANREFVRFLSWSAAVVVIGASLSIALVVVVDPYRLYRLIDVPGFNHVKPVPARYQEEIKLAGARATRANAFILGNSRAEIGFNPDYAGFTAAGYSTYNLAIPGTRASTARRAIAYLRDTGQRPAMLVLGVEFLDFLKSPTMAGSANRVTTSVHAVDQLNWKFDTIFSLASASDAIETLRIQRHPETETMTPRGFNPLLEYNKYAREQGYYALFQQRAMENASTYIGKSSGLAMPENGGSPDMEDLRKILETSSTDKTELHLVIYPYHAQILAMFEQTGLWSAFEQWKRLLAQEVAAIKKVNPDAHVTLWDFSGFSNFQCEIIPSRDDRTSATKWYWEAGHFKPALGDVVLSRLLGKPQESFAKGGMGFPLTPANLDENRQRIERERATCAAVYPQLFSDAAALVMDSRRKHQ